MKAKKIQIVRALFDRSVRRKKRSDRTKPSGYTDPTRKEGMLNHLGRRLLLGDESMSSSFRLAPAGRGKKGFALYPFEQKGFGAFWFLRRDVTVVLYQEWDCKVD